MYSFYRDAVGQIFCNYWTGFSKVPKNPVRDVTFFLAENILRKVLLYDCGNDLMTVVDYMRPWNHFPCVPIVPVHAEKGDMLLIQGEGPTDVWYGHVQDVAYLNKTVDVSSRVIDVKMFLSVNLVVEVRETQCLGGL